MNIEKPFGSTPSSRIRILFLEDNALDRELVRRSLKTEGLDCEFHDATTEADFTLAITNRQFDLILSDYRLPGYGGIAALVSAQEKQPDTPFIFLSGTIGEQQAIDILKLGATDYVLKERIERLAPAIRRALKERTERLKRRQTEAALQHSEEQFRLMAENIHEIFWSSFTDQRELHYVSPAYEKIFGRTLSELYATPSSWPDSIHPEDRPRFLRARELLVKGTPYTIEYRITHADGTTRWIEDRGYPVLSSPGNVERIVGVAVNITDRKQLEHRLMQAQKMEAVGQLAGGIAHDFNNALTVINGYARLLLDSSELSAVAQERVRVIYASGVRVGNLTRQLLLFGRKHATNKTAVNLDARIEELARMLSRLIGDDILLELKVGILPTWITADPSLMEQVVMNLAVNGRDAMPKGGRLTIATEHRQISALEINAHPSRRPGHYVCLSVRDTGVGIPPDILPRIFEPFFTTKPIGTGTGLGLAIVFGIVQEHQGWIEVDSVEGSGTCFRVFLPLAPPGATNTLNSQEPLQVRGSETVLLVEDEATVRDFAAAVLQSYGYRILQAVSGVQALETWKWHKSRIAMVVTDMVMPDGMSGLDLAKILLAEKASVKIIFTSGYADDRAREVFALHSDIPFLPKPYLPAALARLVREVLDQKDSGLPLSFDESKSLPNPGHPSHV